MSDIYDLGGSFSDEVDSEIEFNKSNDGYEYGEDEEESEDFGNSWWPDFGEDDDTHLGVFNPYRKMNKSLTYQYLLDLSDLICQLLSAWKKWQLASENLNIQLRDDFNPFGLNLYQLELEDRDELRTRSVAKFLCLFGGQEQELRKFESEVHQLGRFFQACILDILRRCLPSCLPYVVLRSIHSYLMTGKTGHDNIGLVTRDPSRLTEEKLIGELHEIMADTYHHLKIVLFNVNETSESSFDQKRSNLVAKFQSLAEVVDINKGIQ